MRRRKAARWAWCGAANANPSAANQPRKILAIQAKAVGDLTDADYAHMKKVIGFCRRHLAQRPRADRTAGDLTDTRWRWSLMNWGHDPLKGRKGG